METNEEKEQIKKSENEGEVNEKVNKEESQKEEQSKLKKFSTMYLHFKVLNQKQFNLEE